MTLITVNRQGYLEGDYLQGPYQLGESTGVMGVQFEAEIVDEKKTFGAQFDSTIDETKLTGIELDGSILDKLKTFGIQFDAETEALKVMGVQFEGNIIAELKTLATQFDAEIIDKKELGTQLEGIIAASKVLGIEFEAILFEINKTFGVEFDSRKWLTKFKEVYLTGGYLEDPYLAEAMCKIGGIQFNADLQDTLKIIGTQIDGLISKQKALAVQFDGTINKKQAKAVQFDALVSAINAIGTQFEGTIDASTSFGLQAEGKINETETIGIQFDSVSFKATALQFLVALYNTSQLRILCEFPSRGAQSGSGTNAFGNPIATGDNWFANSIEPGDFDITNVNDDIPERVWRSTTGTVSGIILRCDTEVSQGIALDTFYVQNHNLSAGATVTLTGYSDDTFSTVAVAPVNIEVTEDNLYYIAPTLPLDRARYWQINIDDANTSENFIELGIILFGVADIFSTNECFVDNLEFSLPDFKDEIETEGFRNVSNARAQRRKLSLTFRDLLFQNRNFGILRNVFKRFRTTHSCLFIPTPDPDDQSITDRYAIFGKLSQIPREKHNSKGPNLTYIDLTLEIDESR